MDNRRAHEVNGFDQAVKKRVPTGWGVVQDADDGTRNLVSSQIVG